MKNPSNKKKRVLLTILIAIPLLILAVLATAAGSLLVKYHRISYAPSEIVERTDTYVMPNYPDVIPGSESITDYPDATDIPGETPLPRDHGGYNSTGLHRFACHHCPTC